MYIKTEDYEQIAYVIVVNHITSTQLIRASGRTPAVFNMDQAIHNGLPEKYNDENTTEENYWTKYNEKKLRKYINTEITRRVVYGKY